LKPKIFVVEKETAFGFNELRKATLTFDEVTEFIHELQNALVDLHFKESASGRIFYVVVIV
jgi:hypothetical protein